mmetsp:Transcript_634/g.2226  ORF Transcript_634/g.2226 Transcript_634/m.2226 type:complete len:235 (-) Transcript_634:540-1244(-)
MMYLGCAARASAYLQNLTVQVHRLMMVGDDDGVPLVVQYVPQVELVQEQHWMSQHLQYCRCQQSDFHHHLKIGDQPDESREHRQHDRLVLDHVVLCDCCLYDLETCDHHHDHCVACLLHDDLYALESSDPDLCDPFVLVSSHDLYRRHVSLENSIVLLLVEESIYLHVFGRGGRLCEVMEDIDLHVCRSIYLESSIFFVFCRRVCRTVASVLSFLSASFQSLFLLDQICDLYPL